MSPVRDERTRIYRRTISFVPAGLGSMGCRCPSDESLGYYRSSRWDFLLGRKNAHALPVGLGLVPMKTLGFAVQLWRSANLSSQAGNISSCGDDARLFQTNIRCSRAPHYMFRRHSYCIPLSPIVPFLATASTKCRPGGYPPFSGICSAFHRHGSAEVQNSAFHGGR